MLRHLALLLVLALPSSLQSRLERAADGLLKVSESDAPLRYVDLGRAGPDDLTPRGFARRMGVPEQDVDVRSLDAFFPTVELLAGYHGATPSSPAVQAELRRWNDLATLLRRELRDVTVLRVGKIEVRCYIVGLTPTGELAGLETTVIET